MSLIQTSSLSVGYSQDKPLLSDLNLEISKGSITGLIGQNGVGKSTLIRTLCGLQQALGGEVILDGLELNSLSSKELARKLSVVLTGKPESLNLSVIELIALGRFPHSGWLGTLKEEDKEVIEQAITQMEINYLATKKLFELSDGQMQKVMIARALAQDTPLIILDEPTSHLDLKNKIEVLELLRKIASSGKGILISTHEIQLVSKVCESFWCVDFQKPILVGQPRDLIEKGMVHDYLHLPKEIVL